MARNSRSTESSLKEGEMKNCAKRSSAPDSARDILNCSLASVVHGLLELAVSSSSAPSCVSFPSKFYQYILQYCWEFFPSSISHLQMRRGGHNEML
jgi:hypothetical protein